MKDITPILKSVGLLDSEIKTYLKALERGPSSVLQLAKFTGLSRQATYVAIQSLTDRGIMTSALHGKKRLYAAEHPDKLLAYAERKGAELKERIGDLKRALPELQLRAGGEKPTVKVFEGAEGLRSIIIDMQKPTGSKITHEIADLEALNKVLTPEDLKPMRTELKKTGRHVYGLYAGEPIGKTVSSDRHFLPAKYKGFKANVSVYGNKVALVTFEGKMHSVLIENKALADTVRILFELAIERTKKL